MPWRSSFRNRNRRSSFARRQFKTRKNPFYRLAVLSFFAVAALFLLSFIVFPIFALELPSPDKIVRHDGFSTKIYDRNGVLLYDIYANQRRTPVKLSDIPPYLRQATIATEDKNFYQHQGFDIRGILRSVFNLLIHHQIEGGGSTITQQLVKNVLLSSEQTFLRKIKELVLAIQIERRYTKDEILQMYFNEAPYGGTAWGVEAASEIYFDKPVKNLTLVESAILAGLPQSPTYYSPYGTHPTAFLDRTKHVLYRMEEDGYINVAQEKEAETALQDIKFAGKNASFKAPHFVMYVQSLLEDRYGANVVEQGGLKVTTTLDWDLQKQAQEAVSEEIAKVESLHITNGAAVVIDPNNGEILAMIGSKDFSAKDYDGQVNVALSLRQPGSSIKPVTYVTAFKKGYTPATVLVDSPTKFPGGVGKPDYTPVDYDGKFRGPVQVRYALANSLNIPAVKMLSLVGVHDMLETAYDMGISTLKPTTENLQRFGLSVTLGGGEVRLLDETAAYQAFANGGLRYDPVAILKVEDSKGKVLEEYKPGSGERVLTSEQAFLISNILSDNQARSDVFGLHSALFIPGRTVAVKTGTTNDQRDNWTLGWTPQVVVGVWVGNNDNTPMKSVASGITGASPIWRRIITAALSGKPAVDFTQPSGIVTEDVDSFSGYKAHDGFASRTEYFVKGTEPVGDDPVHTFLKVCKEDGKLATPSQVAAHDYEEREFYVLKEEDPFGPPNRWQEGVLQWTSQAADSRYHPPTDYCGGGNPVNVDFVTPTDKEKVDSSDFDVRVNPQSSSAIIQVEISLDGKKYLITQPPWQIHLSGVADGIHELIAVAHDQAGNISNRKITIGVNVNPSSPSPSPTP